MYLQNKTQTLKGYASIPAASSWLSRTPEIRWKSLLAAMLSQNGKFTCERAIQYRYPITHEQAKLLEMK
jgi:hypothetical protein